MSWVKTFLCWLDYHPVGHPYDGDKYAADWKAVDFADWECTCPHCGRKAQWP